jgi:hypothetical protein
LMTLGPAIMLLPMFERLRGPVADFFTTFGRVPFFFYVLHVPLIHAAAVIYGLTRGWIPGWWWLVFEGRGPAEYTLNLWLVWLVWIAVVLALWPLCAWYARLKRRRSDWWFKYL